MPFFSDEDFDKLLHRMDAMKMNIHRLDMNVEGNAGYGNETTLQGL